MSLQHCPDEVLDMIFQLLLFQSPDKAPTTLLPTLLTCRRFCVIARRYLIRVVCLESAERVNLFAAYLTQLTNAGAYGRALLPIEHMAASGNYQPTRGCRRRRQTESEDQRAAESIIPFIISTAAPSLRSLTIFRFGYQYTTTEVDGQYLIKRVKSSVRFPKLQWLVLLEQDIMSLHRTEIPNGGCRFPRLTSLYTHRGCINDGVLTLRTLRELRLHLLREIREGQKSYFPSSPNLRIETIIIDALPYQKNIWAGRCRSYQSRSKYQKKTESYHAFVKAISSSSESFVVITKTDIVRPKLVLGAWKDIVQGGPGCWKKGWEPTTEGGGIN